jgi:nucleoside-diphosphate-sugar epimerase
MVLINKKKKGGKTMKIKAIITGSTGMVGKGVLLECLESEAVESILVINREPIGIQHPKLEEIILKDFMDLETIENRLKGYNACFHCLGVSSAGMKEEAYHHITYSITEVFANILHEQNPDMVFIYVSGSGTDSSETGPIMWARVKGKTENMVFQKGFKDAYAFRPGAILPEKGIKSRTAWYNAFYFILRPFFPILRRMKSVTTNTKIGQAMINSVLYPDELKILNNKEINGLASFTIKNKE